MGKLPMIILYVSDQQRSSLFYERILDKKPILDVSGMTEFKLNEKFLLGLMPENGIAKILGGQSPHPKIGSGVPRCELYLFVKNPAESLELAVQSGAKEISKAEKRPWGDLVAYCADLDGHIIAFAL